MGKVRRYKKKLAKAAVAGTKNDSGEHVEHSRRTTDYLELAEELLSLRKGDDKMSVCSVVKGVKSISGDDQFKLKKDSKRYLKHAFLLKRLEKTQKSISKNKKMSRQDDSGDDDNDCEIATTNQKVLNWSTGNTISGEHRNPPKKHGKGFQKKQNAQLAKDLKLFSKKIKKQLKNPAQNVTKNQ